MDNHFKFFMLCFTSLFTLINPLGALPVFLAITEKLPRNLVVSIARRACIVSAVSLIFFAATGSFLFSFFSISVPSLKIVGGILFFIMGYDMLQARLSRIETDQSTEAKNFDGDIAITPLAIPMLCGPGAITAVMLHIQAASDFIDMGTLVITVLMVCALAYVILISGKRLTALIGESGNRVFLRIMGLIVMVIAVEFFVAGLKPIVQSMR